MDKTKRAEFVVEGLKAVGANVSAIADEIRGCSDAELSRAGTALANIAQEEAGKFLILMDAYRSPLSEETTLEKQFGRAQSHLPKLIYAYIANSRIASQAELMRALHRLRQSRYLDGPNDCDWIFRNKLIMEREAFLYVDLIDLEGDLQWWNPRHFGIVSVPESVLLVQAIMTTGLVSKDGLRTLSEAWDDFDQTQDTHCSKWAERTTRVLEQFPPQNVTNWWLADHWPMPIVELEVEQIEVSMEDLERKRDEHNEAWIQREYSDAGWW